VCKYQSLYGWKKPRFRMDQADIRAIQSDPAARDNARVMLRRSFRLRGLLLPLSVASKLTSACDIRQRSVMALNVTKNLGLVFEISGRRHSQRPHNWLLLSCQPRIRTQSTTQL